MKEDFEKFSCKCMGCRKGVGFFIIEKDQLCHLDIFATPEAGATYKCENTGDIEKYIAKNDNGFYVPNKELKAFYENEGWWWENILDLAWAVLKEQDAVGDFFNTGEKGNMNWNLPLIEVEKKLLDMAAQQNFVVTEDEFSGLRIFGNV